MSDGTARGFTRRNFLRTSATATTSMTLFTGTATAQTSSDDSDVGADEHPTIRLTINGQTRSVTVEPRTTLVEALRDTLGLTGTKIGCNHGQCGACTVLIDGRRINSCLVLAVSVEGAEITTIEGLSKPTGEPHPMQEAFAEHDAFQCGYCTPGQILSAIACIDEGHAGTKGEIREYMSGNLCRCAAYPNIVAAIETVREQKKG
jgi:xanthine dehydrogenase YagT iron-sulfur-binding subunit